MKKITQFLLIALTVILTPSLCLAVADPAVNGAKVNPAPITVATGISVSFNTANNGTATSSNRVTITISLSLLAPSSTFNILTDITGAGAGRFTWTYNASANTFLGVLNSSFPAAGGGLVEIGNLVSTGLSSQGAEANGLNVNVISPAPVNSSTTNDNSSAYTYSSAALPVKLISFNAKAESAVVNLDWATTEETNSDYFEIQHSVTGKQWSKVDKVTSHGESKTLINYTFSHLTPVNGENLYRLKMVDKDETFAYSSIRSVTFEGQGSDLSVYPNPVSEKLFIRNFNQVTKVNIYNQKGLSVYKSGAIKTGEIGLSNLSPGVYIVKISRSNGLESAQKIVVSK